MKVHISTDIEKIMQKALEDNNIDYVHPYPVRGKYGYIFDFIILPRELNLAVECDGEHWHPIGNTHDRKRDGFTKKHGWKILRFRGEKIKNNVNSCIAQIKGEIKNGRKNIR